MRPQKNDLVENLRGKKKKTRIDLRRGKRDNQEVGEAQHACCGKYNEKRKNTQKGGKRALCPLGGKIVPSHRQMCYVPTGQNQSRPIESGEGKGISVLKGDIPHPTVNDANVTEEFKILAFRGGGDANKITEKRNGPTEPVVVTQKSDRGGAPAGILHSFGEKGRGRKTCGRGGKNRTRKKSSCPRRISRPRPGRKKTRSHRRPGRKISGKWPGPRRTGECESAKRGCPKGGPTGGGPLTKTLTTHS